MNLTDVPDVQSLCRTCLSQHNNDSDIFSGKCFNEQTFSEILMDYASIQVCKNERLSSFICHSCAEYLKTFAAFRNKCIETESALCDFLRGSRFDIEVKKELEDKITVIEKECSFSMREKISFRQCLRTHIDSCTKNVDESNIIKVKTEVDDEETNDGSTQSCFSTSYERGSDENIRTYFSLQECIDIKKDNEDFVDDENTTSEVSLDVDERSSFSNSAQKFSSDTRNECEQVLIKCESSDGTCVTDSDNGEDRSLESRRIRSGHYSFTCDLCSGSFETKTHFDEHLKTHCKEKEDLYVHSKKKKPFACDLCTKSYFRAGHLAAHRNLHISKNQFKCNKCEKFFSSNKSLLGHMRNHTDEKPFKCNECEKSFSAKKNLGQHKKVHTTEKPFKCDTCGMAFAVKTSLVKHSHVHSKKKKPFACDLCTKSFVKADRLATHKNMHLGRKPFKCNECEKSFSAKTNLGQHKKVHTTEKPFKCDTCGMAFAVKTSLVKHSYVHSKKKKPFACDLCTKTFITTERLAAHKNMHLGKNPFKCNECEKSFLSNIYLNRHKTVHTGEKPFVCGVCGAAFKLKEYLLKHTYRHTGQQMPHQCEMCEKSYFFKSRLKTHQEQAHKINTE